MLSLFDPQNRKAADKERIRQTTKGRMFFPVGSDVVVVTSGYAYHRCRVTRVYKDPRGTYWYDVVMGRDGGWQSDPMVVELF